LRAQGSRARCERQAVRRQTTTRNAVGRPASQGDEFMSAGKKRRIEVEDVGDVAVVEFLDKRILDEQNIQLIADQLFELVDTLGKKKLLLNFANVEYLSSAALGKLMQLNKKAREAKGKLALCNIKAEIKEVFLITKLDKVLQIFDNEEKALEAL
jgi:anti-sigma B factor antagonist